MGVWHAAGCSAGEGRRCQISLNLMGVRHQAWLLGTKLESSARAVLEYLLLTSGYLSSPNPFTLKKKMKQNTFYIPINPVSKYCSVFFKYEQLRPRKASDLLRSSN